MAFKSGSAWLVVFISIYFGRVAADTINTRLTETPCQQTDNSTDVIIDCTIQSLTVINSTWFPVNTTILILDNNFLTEVENGLFKHLNKLRYLSIACNKLSTLNPMAFSGLENVEVLNLEGNMLSYTSKIFPDTIFNSLINLKQLYLLQKLIHSVDQYHSRFLYPLKKLTKLSINSINDTVYFGEEFQNLTKLTCLTISGYSRYITNESFVNVKHLAELNILHFESLSGFSPESLAPLILLDKLTIFYVSLKNEIVLNVLGPLVGRKMSSITLHKLSSSQAVDTIHSIQDGILDATKTKYLIDICVERFEFSHSKLNILAEDALFSETWHSCLKYLDLSENPWHGTGMGLLRVFTLRSLEVFIARNLYFTSNTSRKFQMYFGKTRLLTEPNVVQRVDFKDLQASNNQTMDRKDMKNSMRSRTIRDKAINITKESSFGMSYQDKCIIVYVSKALRHVELNRIGTHGYADLCIIVRGADNLEYIDISDNGLCRVTGSVIGLNQLKTLIISGNNFSVMSETFFDSRSLIENLGMANCHFDLNFFQTKSFRFFHQLKILTKIDLSLNSFRYLSKDIFAHNPELLEVYLATNRFTEVPFHLEQTPNLKLLDLSENTITTLEEKITNQLDELAARSKDFSLRLEGNILSCGCGNFRFVKWLLTTHVNIDLSSNLTCVDESGLYMRLDTDLNLETFWRQCWGKEFLLFSLVIFCLIIISFVVSFVFMRFKLYIMSKIAQLLGTVTLQRITDFPINVFLTSNEEDRFALVELREFLTKRLRLPNVKTVDDFTPGHPKLEGYGSFMSESWRIILVVNEDFMNDESFLFNCNIALCSLSPANPGRVILLVEERLLSRLPVDLVGAIDEENILPVSRWELTYELQENLKTRIII